VKREAEKDWGNGVDGFQSSQRPDLANLLPERPAGANRLGGVETMLVVAVAGSRGAAGARGATVHPAASPPPGHGGRPAWPSQPRADALAVAPTSANALCDTIKCGEPAKDVARS
jgi:hypothetical protein